MGNARNIAFWVVLFLMILALFNAFGGNSAQMNSTQIAYSDFIQRVENDQVTAATIDGETVIVTGTDGHAVDGQVDHLDLGLGRGGHASTFSFWVKSAEAAGGESSAAGVWHPASNSSRK